MYKLGWEQFLPFFITIIAILASDLLKGIGVGIVVSIYFILRKNYRNSYQYKSEKTNSNEVVTLTLSEEVTFLNKVSIQETLINLPEDSKIIIDGSKSKNIDYDVLEIIQDFKMHSSKLKNITVETINIPEIIITGSH